MTSTKTAIADLDINLRIELLKSIKPLTDYLREITNNHDINGLNGLLIQVVVDALTAQRQQLDAALPEIEPTFDSSLPDYDIGVYRGRYDAITEVKAILQGQGTA